MRLFHSSEQGPFLWSPCRERNAPAVGPEQGAVMLKTIAAILAAAIIAATITVISAPITDVVASPLPKPAADAITACKQRPWPYLNCVGTEFGNPRVRLVSIDRPTH